MSQGWSFVDMIGVAGERRRSAITSLCQRPAITASAITACRPHPTPAACLPACSSR